MLAASSALAATGAAPIQRFQPRTSVRPAAASAYPAAAGMRSGPGSPEAASTAWQPPHATKYAAGLTQAFASWTAQNVGQPFAAAHGPDAAAAAADPPAAPPANNGVVSGPRLPQRVWPRQARSFAPRPF